jgi:hypothetical protein
MISKVMISGTTSGGSASCVSCPEGMISKGKSEICTMCPAGEESIDCNLDYFPITY